MHVMRACMRSYARVVPDGEEISCETTRTCDADLRPSDREEPMEHGDALGMTAGTCPGILVLDFADGLRASCDFGDKLRLLWRQDPRLDMGGLGPSPVCFVLSRWAEFVEKVPESGRATLLHCLHILWFKGSLPTTRRVLNPDSVGNALR